MSMGFRVDSRDEMDAITDSVVVGMQTRPTIPKSIMVVFATPAGIVLAGMRNTMPKAVVLLKNPDYKDLPELFGHLQKCTNLFGLSILVHEMARYFELLTGPQRLRFIDLMEQQSWCSEQYSPYLQCELLITDNLEAVRKCYPDDPIDFCYLGVNHDWHQTFEALECAEPLVPQDEMTLCRCPDNLLYGQKCHSPVLELMSDDLVCGWFLREDEEFEEDISLYFEKAPDYCLHVRDFNWVILDFCLEHKKFQWRCNVYPSFFYAHWGD